MFGFRPRVDPTQPGFPDDAAVTAAISANKLRLTFARPVIVKGVPAVTVNNALPTGVTVISRTVIDLSYAANVAAGQTWKVPARCAGLRSSGGGFVAAAAGTF